jgi:endonuclease/exonuclease/phosphatase family metal-dependent hydrolase
MKKTIIFIILICVSIFALVFSSCDSAEASAETTENETTAQIEETEPIPQTLKFAEGGKCAFYIVYPRDFDNSIKDVALSLRNQMKKYIGVELKLASDEILAKPIGDTGVEHQYEILLGTADREASKKVTESMRTRDYAVTFEGDKIVLAGTTIDTVKKAVDRFITDVIIKQGKNNMGSATIELTDANKFFYTYGKYTISNGSILGADISDYTIVYSKQDIYSAERYARLFANVLSTSAGYGLPIKADTSLKSDDGTAREIIFGVTKHGGEAVEIRHGYSINAAGTKLYVSAECMEGYAAAYKYLTDTLFKGEKVEIAEGFAYSGVAEPEDKKDIENRAGEYRVVFNNVHGAHTDEYPMESRNQMQAELHFEYLPDVIGLQENAACVATYHTRMKKFGYSPVPITPTNSNKQDYTAMLYRADKLDIVKCGYDLYDDGAGDKSKSVSWAVFKDKASGDVFAVGSTHFYWTSDDLGKSARIKDAAQLAEVVKDITSKYNCPMIVGGDFNCNISSDPMKNLFAAGFEDLQKISPDTMDITTHHSYSPWNDELNLYIDVVMPTKAYSSAIDHAIVYNKSTLTPKMFRVQLHDYTLLSSDHCPVMVDFDIN